MKIKRIAHIGVAVTDSDAAGSFFQEKLDLAVDNKESLGELRVAFLPVGETNIELVQSTTEDGVIAKYIAKKGEGIHHIALEVEDLAGALEELKARGVKLIDETPRPGAHGCLVAFLHPKETHGVLTELVEYPQSH